MAGRIYQTAIAISASISRAFGRDTKNAADSLKKLSEATKQLKAAEKAATAFKKLDDEVTRSKARYDVASAALRRLEEAEKAAGGATKEATQWRRAGERAVASAARQLDRATKAAQKNSEALQKLGVDTSKLTSERERLTRALAATERQEKALGRYEAAREMLFGARSKTPLVSKAGEQVRGLASDALLLATATVGAGAAMAGLVVHTLKAGDEIGDTADKLGIAATGLQELRYGARQSGAEVEDLDRAIAKMAINIGKHKMLKGKGGGGALGIPGLQMLNTGSGEVSSAVVDPFKQIGLRAKHLAGLKPEEQLKKIADGMAKLKTQSERAAIAQEIFGKGATSILPFLAEGSAGIEKLSRDAHKYGGVLSEAAIKNADLADKAMRDAQMAISGLTATLGAELLPTVTNVFRTFSGWVASNRGQIKQWAESAAKWIETKGIPAFKNIAAEMQSFGAKVLWLLNGAVKLTGGFGNLAIVVAGLRIAPLAVTLGKIGVEATKAAIAIYKYAAASSAAKAAGGGIPGIASGAGAVMGNAIGLAAKASMILGAAAIGYEIGTAIDEATGGKLSDAVAKALGWISGEDDKLKNIEDTGVKAHDLMLQRKKLERDARVRDFQARGYSRGQALYLADHPDEAGALRPATIRTGGGGGRVSVHVPVTVHGSASRDDVARGMDHAKQKALEEFDRREAHRRRVSFG